MKGKPLSIHGNGSVGCPYFLHPFTEIYIQNSFGVVADDIVMTIQGRDNAITILRQFHCLKSYTFPTCLRTDKECQISEADINVSYRSKVLYLEVIHFTNLRKNIELANIGKSTFQND